MSDIDPNYTPDEVNFFFKGKAPTTPNDAQLKKFCHQYGCSVDMNRLNLYKSLQQIKFHKSMETNEHDRNKYSKYLAIRAVYYYGKNKDKFDSLAKRSDAIRTNFFQFVWRASLIKEKRRVRQSTGTASSSPRPAGLESSINSEIEGNVYQTIQEEPVQMSSGTVLSPPRPADLGSSIDREIEEDGQKSPGTAMSPGDHESSICSEIEADEVQSTQEDSSSEDDCSIASDHQATPFQSLPDTLDDLDREHADLMFKPTDSDSFPFQPPTTSTQQQNTQDQE